VRSGMMSFRHPLHTTMVRPTGSHYSYVKMQISGIKQWTFKVKRCGRQRR
jgi:hypothetical protein